MNKNHSTFQIQKSRREAKKKEREAREAEERRQEREAAERERRLKEEAEAEAKLRMTPQQNQPLMVGSCSFSTRNLLLYLNRYELGLIAIEKAKNMLVFYVA